MLQNDRLRKRPVPVYIIQHAPAKIQCPNLDLRRFLCRSADSNAFGSENLSTTTFGLQTSLNVDCLGRVNVLRIAENKTLNVGVDIWHEAACF